MKAARMRFSYRVSSFARVRRALRLLLVVVAVAVIVALAVAAVHLVPAP